MTIVTTQHIWYESLEKINLSLLSFETGNLSADNFKNSRPRWVNTWARRTVRWYWSADALFWQLSIDHNIDVQLVFSWAPKLAKKCESKHCFSCGADGRLAVGVRSRDYQIFWDGKIYLAMVLRPRAKRRAWSSAISLPTVGICHVFLLKSCFVRSRLTIAIDKDDSFLLFYVLQSMPEDPP